MSTACRITPTASLYTTRFEPWFASLQNIVIHALVCIRYSQQHACHLATGLGRSQGYQHSKTVSSFPCNMKSSRNRVKYWSSQGVKSFKARPSTVTSRKLHLSMHELYRLHLAASFLMSDGSSDPSTQSSPVQEQAGSTRSLGYPVYC